MVGEAEPCQADGYKNLHHFLSARVRIFERDRCKLWWYKVNNLDDETQRLLLDTEWV